MFNMTYTIYYFLVLGMLQIQLIKSQNRYCPEAVSSMQSVAACPTSKIEWNNAALKKNCSELAPRQNCVSVNKFKYHCVINELRNKLVEVCAPERIIFGHCVEFNFRGGVIQDQKSAPCNKTFPKCDRFYYSTDAYKYTDCYMLVPKGKDLWLTTKDTSAKLTTMRTITDESLSSQTITAILTTIFIAVIAVLVLIFKQRRMRRGMKMDESKEAMLREIDVKHDYPDGKEKIEKEDEPRLLLNPDHPDGKEKIEKEDEPRLLLNPDYPDGKEKIEKEDEPRLLLNPDNTDDEVKVKKIDELVKLLNSHYTDDKEKIEKEDEPRLLLNSDNTDDKAMVKKNDELLNSHDTDDKEKIEKENELRLLLNCETRVLINHGRRRINSVGF